jgi:tetratricopeptide (TPR) repeat protein
MAELWQGVGTRPMLDGLDSETKAEVLLRTGALTGWIGSASQIEGSQEMAKDLISESLRTFEQLGQRSRVGEARSDLALCYWRLGAFDEARVTLQSALDDFDEGDTQQKAIALLRRAEVERSSASFDQALLTYEQAAPLFNEVNEHYLAAAFHVGFASVLNQLSENRKEYVDIALIEYAAASFHFEQAGHIRYQACVENNLGLLYGTIGKFEDAHEHLDRAQVIATRLKDDVHVAQFDDTRARVLIAEGRIVEAEKTARAAVRRLEKGDELSLLAEALTTQGIALAWLNHSAQAQAALDRAIKVAEQAGDFQSAGVAALSLIEQLGASLANKRVAAAIDRVGALLETTRDASILRRLAKALGSLLRTHTTPVLHSWTNFSLRQSVIEYEATLITRALEECGGSVTRAARLLGVKNHQSLTSIINTRHKELLAKRSPVRKRRQPLMTHPK